MMTRSFAPMAFAASMYSCYLVVKPADRTILPLIRDGLCGAIYTQVSDVEDETNGLFTFDRAVLKLQPNDLTNVMNDMDSAIAKTE